MLTYADVFWRMLTYADVCSTSPARVGKRGDVQQGSPREQAKSAPGGGRGGGGLARACATDATACAGMRDASLKAVGLLLSLPLLLVRAACGTVVMKFGEAIELKHALQVCI